MGDVECKFCTPEAQMLTQDTSRNCSQHSSGRAIYSNSAENFKRPKNREDSSDLDENLTESIAATQTFISKKIPRRTGSKNMFLKNFSRESLLEYLSL